MISRSGLAFQEETIRFEAWDFRFHLVLRISDVGFGKLPPIGA